MILRILVLLSLVIATLFCAQRFLTEPFLEKKENPVDVKFKLSDELYFTKDSLNIHAHYKNVQTYLAKPYFQDLTVGLVYREDEKIEKYYADLTRNANPVVVDIGYICLASIYSGTKRTNFSKKELSRVTFARTPYYHTELAYVHLYEGRIDEALASFLTEHRRDPRVQRTVQGLASVYYQQNNFEALSDLYNDDTKEWLKDYSAKIFLYRFELGSFLVNKMEKFPVNWTNILAAFAVAMLWIFYLKKIDLFSDISVPALVTTFCISLFATFLGSFLFDAMDVLLNYRIERGFHRFVYCFLGIGLVEEIIKLIPVFICFRLFKSELNSPLAYLSIAFASALGFATLENALYFDWYPGTVIYKRAFVCVTGHLFYTSLVVYGLKIVSWGRTDYDLKYGALYLLAAIGFHGLYDSFLMVKALQDIWMVSLMIALFELYGLYRILNYAINFSPNFDVNVRYKKEQFQFFLITGFTLVYLIEFALNSMMIGYTEAFDLFMVSLIPFLLLLSFWVSNLSSLDIVKNLRTGIFTVVKKFKFEDLLFSRIDIVSNSAKKIVDPIQDVESRERIQYSQKGIFIRLKPAAVYQGFSELVLQPIQEHVNKGHRKFEALLLGIKHKGSIHALDANVKDLSVIGKVEAWIPGENKIPTKWYERIGTWSAIVMIIIFLTSFVIYMNYISARSSYQDAVYYLEIKSPHYAYSNLDFASYRDEGYADAKLLKAKIELYTGDFKTLLANTNGLVLDTKRKRTSLKYIRAKAYLGSKQPERAHALFSELMTEDNAPDSIYFYLANIEFDRNKYQAALNFLTNFSNGKVSEERIRLESKCYMALTRYKEAEVALQSLRKSRYIHDGQYYADFGKCYLEIGDTLKACTEFNSGSKFNHPESLTLSGIHCVRFEEDTISVIP